MRRASSTATAGSALGTFDRCVLACFTLLPILSGCGSSSAPDGAAPASVPVGGIAPQPGQSTLLDGNAYVLESNQGGGSEYPRLLTVSWGRLVDIYDTVPTSANYQADPLNAAAYETRLVFRDFVIGQDVLTSFEGGVLVWEFSTNPVNGRSRLRINANVEQDTDLFALRLAQAEQALDPIAPKGLGPTELPPYSVLARNSALSLRFDDLIDESTIGLHSTVAPLVGSPPSLPFDARIFASRVHGAVSPLDGQFHSSRIVVDLTISDDEVASFPSIVQANGVGLPASADQVTANFALRIPTVVDTSVLQPLVLTNVAGNPLDAAGSGSADFNSPTDDVVWAMRSGNGDDADNGFLVDLDPPRIVGRQAVEISSASETPGGVAGRDFTIGVAFNVEGCATDPLPGDVLQVSPAVQLEVTEPGTAVGGQAFGVRVTVVSDIGFVAAEDLAGSVVEYQTPWRESLGSALAPCFVRFSPSAKFAPNTAVDPDSQVRVRFSEPVDPGSARPYDSFYVARSATVDPTLANSLPGAPIKAPGPDDLVLGRTIGSSDGREMSFAPLLPLSHEAGQSESYWFGLVSNFEQGGVTDLAGNASAESFPRVEFTLDSGASSVDSGGWVLRFNSVDEDGIAGPEVRGQFSFDVTDGRLMPRPVERFSRVVDDSQPVVASMSPFGGLQTPFSSQGSKAHLMWRYMDMGFSVSQVDDLFYNLDVEGLALAPTDGNVISTIYPKFEMRLGHAARLPDEALNAALQPAHRNSGLVLDAPFEANFLDDPLAGPVIVHDRDLGFAISSVDIFKSSSNRSLLPMPLNRGVDEFDKSFYTWRDTAVLARGNVANNGALIGAGAPTDQETQVLSLPVQSGDVWGPSIPDADSTLTAVGLPAPALPLLMEYRCFPVEVPSLNNFDVTLGIGGWSEPRFRAFSTGGVDLSLNVVNKDPDLATVPDGGFNGDLTLGAIGAPTMGQDPTVYLGQVDIVIRISRAYTILVDAEQDPVAVLPPVDYDYAAVSVEPAAAAQPFGTSVIFAWRGDSPESLDPELSAMLDASRLDVFGEPISGPLSADEAANRVHPWADPTWRETLEGIDGHRFVQTRVTFVSNTASLQTPTLDAYGLAFYR